MLDGNLEVVGFGGKHLVDSIVYIPVIFCFITKMCIIYYLDDLIKFHTRGRIITAEDKIRDKLHHNLHLSSSVADLLKVKTL